MHFFKAVTFLLPAIPLSSSQQPVPANENGAAIVINECNFPVYYKSVGNSSVPLSTMPAKGIYKETFRLNIVNGIIGGISIKLSPNQTIITSTNPSDAFDNSTITQFEYTYNPNEAPGL